MNRSHRGSPLLKGQDIADRMQRLAAACMKIVLALPKHPALRNLAVQLARASSAAGALYGEARAAQSRADFIHKVSLAAKELRETIEWLQLAHGAEVLPSEKTTVWIDEAMQLAAILGASLRTARDNARKSELNR
jgi:four helix bundle protein